MTTNDNLYVKRFYLQILQLHIYIPKLTFNILCVLICNIKVKQYNEVTCLLMVGDCVFKIPCLIVRVHYLTQLNIINKLAIQEPK